VLQVPIIFFKQIAFIGLSTYTPEVYPTSFRASGCGACTFLGRLGGVLGPLVFALFLEESFRSAMVFLSVTLLVPATGALFLPFETMGKRMVDSLDDIPEPPSCVDTLRRLCFLKPSAGQDMADDDGR
jgi:hypothetical protein